MLPKKRSRLIEVLTYIANKIPAGELSETDINAQIQGLLVSQIMFLCGGI
ncbi:MAG: hypothetical protein ABF913_05570 [Oenococcus sp.]